MWEDMSYNQRLSKNAKRGNKGTSDKKARGGLFQPLDYFMAPCLICQQVKAEHQRPSGLLHPLLILEWKWEHITMNFVIGLPRTTSKNKTIWVIIDRLAKSVHFLPIKAMWPLTQLAELYVREIIRLHGAPVSIVSDRDSTP